MTIAVATNVNVRIEIVGDVVVGGRGKNTNAHSRHQLSQVERNDLGERAVEQGGKFIEREKVLSVEC